MERTIFDVKRNDWKQQHRERRASYRPQPGQDFRDWYKSIEDATRAKADASGFTPGAEFGDAIYEVAMRWEGPGWYAFSDYVGFYRPRWYEDVYQLAWCVWSFAFANHKPIYRLEFMGWGENPKVIYA